MAGTVAMAAFFGVIALRATGLGFLMITLALSQVLWGLAYRMSNVTNGDMHCFHPQIVATGTGVIGCAFYVFGQEFNRWLIRVQLAASWDDGATFSQFITVTDQSWDPLVNAPAVHGDPNVHFIGEYFGLAISNANI